MYILFLTDYSADMMFDSVRIEEMNIECMFEAFRQMCPGQKEDDGIAIQCLEVTPGRRVIKCHYPLDLMPPDLLDKTKVSQTTELCCGMTSK